MSEMTQEEERNLTFRLCKKNQLHLYYQKVRVDIALRLEEVAEDIEKYKTVAKPDQFEDLRLIDNEYVASYIGNYNDKTTLNHIYFHRESGTTDLYFDFRPPYNNTDFIPSYETLENFIDSTVQGDGSLIFKSISFVPEKSIYSFSTQKDRFINKEGACLCFSECYPLKGRNVQFQPSSCAKNIYARDTGLPIIENNFETITPTSSLPFGTSFTPSKYDLEHSYFVSWHMAYELESNGYTIKPPKKSVVLVHKNQQAFLDGEDPFIIIFQNVDGRNDSNGVFRRLPDGSYIDNSSVKEESGSITYNVLSLQEIIDRSETLIRPHCDFIMNAARGEFEKVIPQKYIDIYKDVLSRVRPDGQGNSSPENDDPEL